VIYYDKYVGISTLFKKYVIVKGYDDYRRVVTSYTLSVLVVNCIDSLDIDAIKMVRSHLSRFMPVIIVGNNSQRRDKEPKSNDPENIHKSLIKVYTEIESIVVKKEQHSEAALFATTPPTATCPIMDELAVSLTVEPYGKIVVRDRIYWPKDDGNSYYNWYTHRFYDQIIPGAVLWSNEYRNADLIQGLDADKIDSSGYVSMYDLTTYVGSTQVT